ncbi:MAG: helix-turn-helix domain-containing protein [Pseudomonadota bacterium]|nr:helix-turn-helix domain-containing protein [Pseudomonadota bacterium]
MKLEGFLKKPSSKEKIWAIEIPAIGIFTQGKSKKDAYLMAKDAIETVVDEKGFAVVIEPLGDLSFSVSANEQRLLIGLLLRRQRAISGLTLMEVAKRLHSKSPNAYGRYEQGKVLPSLDKLAELLRAIDEDLDPILKIKDLAS